MKKKELLIVVILAIIGLGGVVATKVFKPKAYTGSSTDGNFKSESGVVVAVQNGQGIVLEFDPAVDGVYHVDGDVGGLDVEVKDHKWHVINEKCSNHICAQMGWMGVDDLVPITCLPNNIIIFVESNNG